MFILKKEIKNKVVKPINYKLWQRTDKNSINAEITDRKCRQ